MGITNFPKEGDGETMTTLPLGLDCQTNDSHCQWYMHHKCPETCAYAKDILGVGATDQGTAKRINEGLEKLTGDIK